MFVPGYDASELEFAYCYRVFIRWRTHLLRPLSDLPAIAATALAEIGEQYGIHILEHEADPTNVMTLVSLQPHETVASCVGNLKGQLSKRLNARRQVPASESLFSRGYFACTAGASSSSAVNAYLAKQGSHHGYADRVLPPVFNYSVPVGEADTTLVESSHAFTMLRHHIVLATCGRRGVFLPQAAAAVIERWRTHLQSTQAVLLKAAVVPDHVHLAVRVHPTASPRALIGMLMNQSQQLMVEEFAENLIRASVERLWQPSAYLGSFGDVASPQISQYIRDWVARA